MEKEMKEKPQIIKKSKCNFLTILLIISIIIILGLVAGIIVLGVKLHKKNDDYDELENKYN